MERKIYNPIQKDTVVFLKMSEDTRVPATKARAKGIDKELIDQYVTF